MPAVRPRASSLGSLALTTTLVINIFFNPTITPIPIPPPPPPPLQISIVKKLQKPFTTLFKTLAGTFIQKDMVLPFWTPVIILTLIITSFVVRATHRLLSRHVKVNWKALVYEIADIFISNLDSIEILAKTYAPYAVPFFDTLDFVLVGAIQIVAFKTAYAYFRNSYVIQKIFATTSIDQDEELGLPFATNRHGYSQIIDNTLLINSSDNYVEFHQPFVAIDMNPSSTTSNLTRNQKKKLKAKAKKQLLQAQSIQQHSSDDKTPSLSSSSDYSLTSDEDEQLYLPPVPIPYRHSSQLKSNVVESFDQNPSSSLPGAWSGLTSDNIFDDKMIIDEVVTQDELFQDFDSNYPRALMDVSWIVCQPRLDVVFEFGTAGIIRKIKGLPSKYNGRFKKAPIQYDLSNYGLRKKRKSASITSKLALYEFDDLRGSDFFRSVRPRYEEPRYIPEIPHLVCKYSLLLREIRINDHVDRIIRASINVNERRQRRLNRQLSDIEEQATMG